MRGARPFTALAAKLKATGLDSIKGEHYEGGHWLGSFAVYLVSGRGLLVAYPLSYFFFAAARLPVKIPRSKASAIAW